MPTPAGNPRSETASLWVKVNGTELSADELGQILDVALEQDLVLPDSFAIRIRDILVQSNQQQKNFPMLDGDRFPIGADIQVGMGHEQAAQPVLKGQVTSLELDARGDGNPVLVVRGYDAAYRLHRQRKSRTFTNLTATDIATQVAREYGLSPNTDRTNERHAHLYQHNQTDWELLRMLATRVGFDLFVDMDKRELVFRRPGANSAAPEQEFGANLHRVHLRMSGPAQIDSVVVKGWDPDSKREIEGRAREPSGRAQVGGDRPRKGVASKLGGATFVVADQPVRSIAEADLLAQATFDDIAGGYIQLEGECDGHNGIRPGRSLRFKNLGERFDHEYYLSAASHKLSAGGYTSRFVVSGRRPTTLTALLGGGGSHPTGSRGGTGGGRLTGVFVGVVTNNKDEQYGRVKVKLPWLGNEESHWARLATPMTGGGRGFFFLPEVGDEVLLAFEHGDVNFPYVVGCLWNGQDKPPENAPSVVGPTGKVNKRIIKSRLGHTITLDDSDDKPSITVVDKTGKNAIKLDSTSNKLTIEVDGDISLDAKGSISLNAQRDISVSGHGQVSVQGNRMTLDGGPSVSVKGSSVALN